MNRNISYINDRLFAGSRTQKAFIVTIVLIFIIIFTNLEHFLVSIEGTNAAWWVFVIFYIMELIFLLFIYYVVFPILKNSRQHIVYKLLLCIFWICIGALLSVSVRYLLYNYFDSSLTTTEIKHQFFRAIYRHGRLFFFSGLFYVINQWLAGRVKIDKYHIDLDESRKENLRLQSSLLGAQMNPHLLVNVLNAIQGNIMEKSPESYYLITGIADIQEHLLTKSNIEQVTTLADEIQLIQKVLDLYSDLGQKLGRYNLLINAPVEQITFPSNLLVPLFENIFKHGDLSNPKELPVVNFQIQPSFLELHINNKALPRSSSQHRPSFGIRNCIKRLDTYFSNSYKFSALTNEQRYQLILEIKLKNYD